MIYVFYFLIWTLLLYWIHRASHVIPVIKNYHFHHHSYAIKNKIDWHWSNLFLFNDDLRSTIDLWITEVMPTVVFCAIFNSWYILIFYYIWAALLQERIEHDISFDIPLFTSGKWHLMHHKSACNYGLFFPMWDIIFRTYRKVL